MVDDPTLRLSHDGRVAAYSFTATGVTVDNAGSAASYDLAVPRTVVRARVRVGERTVWNKDGARIESVGAVEHGGSYAVSLDTSPPGRGRR